MTTKKPEEYTAPGLSENFEVIDAPDIYGSGSLEFYPPTNRNRLASITAESSPPDAWVPPGDKPMTNEIELDPELSRLNDLRDICFRVAESKGWYEKCQKDDPNTFAMLLALIHREVSEALGDHRNGCDITEQTWCPHEDKPIGIPTELADVIMLVLSVCGYYGVDIRRAISEKLQYNKERAYRHGGKVV